MDSIVEIQVSTLAVGLLLGILPAALGTTIAVWMTRRRRLSEVARSLQAEHANELVAGLVKSVGDFAGHLGEYRSQMEDISARIGRVDQSDVINERQAETGPEQTDLAAQMATANDRLQQRLDAAEDALVRQAEELSAYLSEARTDPLTSLPNRRAFDAELARRFAERQRHDAPLSVLLMDVDRFKRLNDEHGHLAGDAVLQSIAEVLSHMLRETDLVARFGGEEFAMVLPFTGLSEAHVPAERARRAVAQGRFVHEGVELRATISCGIAEAMPGEDLPSVLRRADEALYAAKRGGRDRGYLHDGRTCRPLMETPTDPDARRPDRPTGGGPVVPAHFAQVCEDLRNQLVETLKASEMTTADVS